MPVLNTFLSMVWHLNLVFPAPYSKLCFHYNSKIWFYEASNVSFSVYLCWFHFEVYWISALPKFWYISNVCPLNCLFDKVISEILLVHWLVTCHSYKLKLPLTGNKISLTNELLPLNYFLGILHWHSLSLLKLSRPRVFFQKAQ